MIALGDFVRRRRQALPPVPTQGLRPRRTPGWRREDVAEAAGLSLTWYTWIEQGREIGVSPAALDRLARVLRLSPPERAYLFELASVHDPLPPEVSQADEAALAACVAAISTPAYVLDPCWNALFWNEAAADLLTPWLKGGEPNLLRFVFMDPAAVGLIIPWEARAFRLVAEFRKEAGGPAALPARDALVADLTAASPAFTTAWQAHHVTDRAGGQRSFSHPERGLVHYRQTSFDLALRLGVKLHILTPLPADASETPG